MGYLSSFCPEVSGETAFGTGPWNIFLICIERERTRERERRVLATSRKREGKKKKKQTARAQNMGGLKKLTALECGSERGKWRSGGA